MFGRFSKDAAGNFAIVTALVAVPLFGTMGLAIDYARGVSARSALQDRADEAVLSVARQGPTGTDRSILNHIQTSLTANSGMTDIALDARWTAINEFTVDISGKLPLTLTQILPSVGKSTDIEVASVGRYKKAIQKPKVPELASLDPEAGDYNRVYAYCYSKEKKNDPKTKGRSNFVAISDNGGTTYKDPMPSCGDGETISYELFNVRDSRSKPNNWNNSKIENYAYYTDTETDTKTKAEIYNLDGWAILETVLCPTLASCKPKSKGGIIPEGKNRTPQRATQECTPGKYMYFGWEDRPPGRGTSDKDYDDIRVIISCPEWEIIGEDVVRLIK